MKKLKFLVILLNIYFCTSICAQNMEVINLCTSNMPNNNCITYYLALIEHNVSATLHIYPTGGHGWGYNDDFYYKREWTHELEK
jgi:hypothetical protein